MSMSYKLTKKCQWLIFFPSVHEGPENPCLCKIHDRTISAYSTSKMIEHWLKVTILIVQILIYSSIYNMEGGKSLSCHCSWKSFNRTYKSHNTLESSNSQCFFFFALICTVNGKKACGCFLQMTNCFLELNIPKDFLSLLKWKIS